MGSFIEEKAKRYAEVLRGLHQADRTAALRRMVRDVVDGTHEPYDPDGGHAELDAILLAAIDDEEVTRAFIDADRWYS